MLNPKLNNDLVDNYFLNFDYGQRAMAASPVSINHCLNLFDVLKPLSILDAGSGLGTLLFHANHKNVTTIDEDEQWAKKTKEILKNILGIKIRTCPIRKILNQSFDFVFYDYGDIETRIYYFKKAISICNSAMYIDDMHIQFYHDYVVSRSKKYQLIDLREETLDEFGRFGYLLLKGKMF